MAFYVLLLAYESLLLCYVVSVDVDLTKEDPPSFFFPFKNYLYSISLQIHKHRKASTMRRDTQTHFMTSE